MKTYQIMIFIINKSIWKDIYQAKWFTSSESTKGFNYLCFKSFSNS